MKSIKDFLNDLIVFEAIINKLNGENNKKVKDFLHRKAIDMLNDNQDWLMISEEYIAIWQPKEEYEDAILQFCDIVCDKYNLIYVDENFTTNINDILRRFDNGVKGFLGHKIRNGDIITICSTKRGDNLIYRHYLVTDKERGGFKSINFRNDWDW